LIFEIPEFGGSFVFISEIHALPIVQQLSEATPFNIDFVPLDFKKN